MRRVLFLLTTLITVVGICAAARLAWNRSAKFLADTWLDQLSCVPESKVEGLVDRIAALGDDAPQALVAALASERLRVSRAAAAAIRREAEAWQAIPPHVRTLRQRRLIDALVDAWPNLDPFSRRVAVDVARLVASMFQSGDAAHDENLLAACSAISKYPIADESPQRLNRPAVADRTAPPEGVSPRTTTESLKILDSAHATDTRLKAESTDESSPRDPAAPLPPSIALNPPSARGLLAPENTAGEKRSDAVDLSSREPRRLPKMDHRPLGETIPAASAVGEANAPIAVHRIERLRTEVESSEAEDSPGHESASGSSNIEAELKRRLRDPDAEVRKKLVRRLPDVVGVDAAPWLLELSRDADAEVRLEAMTLLATTGDPGLLATVQKLAAADPDERIRNLAGRLARRNR